MGNKIDKLTVYKDALEGLYNDGYCKGIISKKKIRILVGILYSEIKKENTENKILKKGDK